FLATHRCCLYALPRYHPRRFASGHSRAHSARWRSGTTPCPTPPRRLCGAMRLELVRRPATPHCTQEMGSTRGTAGKPALNLLSQIVKTYSSDSYLVVLWKESQSCFSERGNV